MAEEGTIMNVKGVKFFGWQDEYFCANGPLVDQCGRVVAIQGFQSSIQFNSRVSSIQFNSNPSYARVNSIQFTMNFNSIQVFLKF